MTPIYEWQWQPDDSDNNICRAQTVTESLVRYGVAKS